MRSEAANAREGMARHNLVDVAMYEHYSGKLNAYEHALRLLIAASESSDARASQADSVVSFGV